MTNDMNSGPTCPITGCPVKKVACATIIVAVVSFLYDWLVHGVLLKADYEATAALWRPMAEMQTMLSFCIVYHLVLAFGAAGLYCLMAKSCACNGKCPKTGLKFGLFLGIIVGISHFSNYIWLPMPMDLAIKWLVAGIVWGLVVGYALSFSCRCGCKKETPAV